MSNQYDRDDHSNIEEDNQFLEKQKVNLHQQNELLRLEQEEKKLAKLQHQAKIERLIMSIYYLGGALMILLTLRFLLRLSGANTNNVFANFIFNLSSPFTIPFADLFNNPKIGQTASFEFTTIIGIGVYALLIWLVVRLIKIIWNP